MKKRFFALLLSIAVILSSMCCITAFADSTGVDSTTATKIKSAFNSYVESAGNSATAEAMVSYINNKVTNVTVSIVNNTSDWATNDWFIYHAVDGCYDETESYKLSIPGHDGYVSAILTVADLDGAILGTVGAVSSIPHIEENLGNLSMSVYSADNTDFTTDANGNITNYSGTAEKIVIPYAFSKENKIINLNNATSKDIVKVVVIGSRVANSQYTSYCHIEDNSFKNWSSLRAVSLPWRIKRTEGIGESAFANNANLKYVDMPNAMAGTSSGYGTIGYGAFNNCPLLENATCSHCGVMTTATYDKNGAIFNNSAIRYMVTPAAGNYKTNCIPATHSYSDGVFVSLSNVANDTNFKASLARAATLAQEAADKIVVSADTTADSIATAITAAYSSKNANITASWTTTPTIDATALTIDDGVYTLALNGQKVDIIVDNNASVVEETVDPVIAENIRNAFKSYVASVGNSAAVDTMVEYINGTVTDVTVSIVNNTSDWATNDWFIYHAVDGCYDETESYKLSIPGHDGYVSAILTVADLDGAILGTVGAVASIPHIEENLGNLSMSVYSADNTDFTTDANGNITNYSGTAEKIVIPYAFTKESKIIDLSNATSKDIVKVVVIGSRVANSNYTSKCHIENNCFKNWGSLRAVSLPWRIQRSEGIGESAFANNANLKYVDMPNAMAGTSGGYGTIGYGAFNNCPVLENAMCSHCGVMTTATYDKNGAIFNNSAIRYMVTPAAGNYKTNCIPATHSYSDGVFVSLSNVANDTNFKASLARAATLAQEAAAKYSFGSEDTQNTVKAAIVGGYAAKTLSSDISADWNDTFTVSNGIVSGTLTLTQGENSVPVEYYYNPFVGLSYLSIDGVEISPAFSGTTYNYTASVLGTKNAVTINASPVSGATMNFSSGSYNLNNGANVFKINSTLASGEVISYTLTVTRNELPKELMADIENAFNTYVEIKGNNSDPDALLSYINGIIAPASVAYDTDGIFIRHAVDGVYDESDDGYPIDIKGRDGSVAVNLKVYDENAELIAYYGDMAVIPHSVENLGELTSVIFDIDAYYDAVDQIGDFEIDADGNIIKYNGDAQKIIITDEYLEDAGFEKVGIAFEEGAVANKDNVVAVVLGGSNDAEMYLTIEKKSFSGWASLRAVELPRRVCGYIGSLAFANNPVLKYVDTPQSIAGISGSGYGQFRNEAFKNCPVLENINSNNPNTRMTTGQLWKQIYEGTAIRDYIYEGYYQHGDSGTPQNIGANPTYNEGTQVIMAVGTNSGATLTPTFTRAATMAQEKASTLTVTADNAPSAMTEITNTYSSKLTGVAAEWSDNTYSELLLTYGEYTIPVIIGDKSYNTAINIVMNANADYRTVAPMGVRYTYIVSGLESLEADENVASVELGTLIVPKDVIANGLTHFELDMIGATYIDVPAVYVENNTVKAVLSNIKTENLARDFSAIGYALITYTDGAIRYVYADDYVTVNPIALANAEINDDVLTDDEKAALKSVIDAAEDNAQNWIDTQYSNSDAIAATMRNDILSSAAGTIDTTVYTGETYYINEENFETYKAMLSYIPAGSIVLFERGGTYRVGGIDVPANNIYFGAYGEGAKPNIYGSIKNFAESIWTNEGENIWSVSDVTKLENNDAGIVIFDDGKMAGIKRATLAEVTSEGDFWYNGVGKVYLYSESDPSTIWNSIEIGVNDHIIEVLNVNGITIDNLNIRYGGAHGVSIDDAVGVTVTNCEIAYVGGSYMTHIEDFVTRYGNGVELWCEGSDILVDNCWIHQIYDSGLTHQGIGSANSGTLFAQKNITFSNNLVEYCALAAIEYWTSSSGSSTEFNTLENINYVGNVLRFAGYGWGTQGVERTGWIIKTSNDCLNKIVKAEDDTHTFYITGNILDTGKYGLIDTAGNNYSSARPILSGNTYIQPVGSVFGKLNSGYEGGASTGTIEYIVDDTIENIISTKFKDQTAILIVY